MSTSEREKRIAAFQKLQLRIQTLNLPVMPAQYLDLDLYLNQPSTAKPIVRFTQAKTSTAWQTSKAGRPLVLVFASAHNPGGGVLRGAKAQEEDMAVSSTWFEHVHGCDAFYTHSHENALYDDVGLYVDKAWLMQDEWGYDLDPIQGSMIGIPSPNLKGLRDQNITLDEHLIYQIYERRCLSLLSFATLSGHDQLIVGAWGCGVFGLDPQKTAYAFAKSIATNRYAGEVLFAIPDLSLLTIYQDVFKSMEVQTHHRLKKNP